jgi:hypothetical protein
MNFNVFISLILGLCMGGAYGVLFLRRIKSYWSEPLQNATGVKKTIFLVVSFGLNYAVAGIFLYYFMQVFHINMILSAVAFLGSFWVVVWRYAKRLS